MNLPLPRQRRESPGSHRKRIPKKRDVGTRVARDIVRGLQAMVDHLEGKSPLPGRRHIVHIVDVKKLRKHLKISQSEFADRFGINLRTLQDWEQGRSAPDQSHRAYLRVIAAIPDKVARVLRAA